jgi:hypothetical protein
MVSPDEINNQLDACMLERTIRVQLNKHLSANCVPPLAPQASDTARKMA